MDKIQLGSSKSQGTSLSIDKEKVDIKELTKKLKSTSFRTAYSSLVQVRTLLMKDDTLISKFQEAGCFRYLVRFLTVSNEQILNLTLSVLANSCNMLFVNREIRDEVLKYGISSKAVGVLNKVNSEAVQKRVFRLIGNLAQASNAGRELHKVHAPFVILRILSSTQDVGVKQAAVRALRWLWDGDTMFHNSMLKAGTVKTITTLLSSEDEVLLTEVIKALVVFTQPCLNETAEQIKGAGDGYSEIVSKINLPKVNVLICNLSFSFPARIELSRVGVVPSIVNILEGGKIDSFLVCALCHLCCESMARASLKSTPMGFKALLSLLTDARAANSRLDVLTAIAQFRYDKQSLKIMVNVGLIGTLVELLGKFVKRHGSQHEESAGGGVDESSSGGDLSPCASPPQAWSPPRTDSAPLEYSPRCSSPEEDVQQEGEEEVEQGIETSASNDVEISNASYKVQVSGEDGRIVEILSQLTYQNISLRPLASKTTITTLVDYLVTIWYANKMCNHNKVLKTLCSIVSCNDYFNCLLNDESILLMHRSLCRPKHRATIGGGCEQCSRLRTCGRILMTAASAAAQSGLGVGEIYYRLAMTDSTAKSSVSLTVPHIINTPSTLHNLLIGHGLLKCLLDSLDTRIEEAVASLHELFNTLPIDHKRTQIEVCKQCDVGSVRKEATVTFELDDGSSVGVNKESLAHNCPVFEAMFRGAFVEARQSRVRLRGVTSDCLAHLARLADAYCSCQLAKAPLPTLLELVTIADRFLLPQLAANVLEYVINVSLGHSSCHLVYDWGLHTTHPLTAEVPRQTLEFLFGSDDMSCGERLAAVRSILEGRNREIFLQDVMQLVIEGLQKYCKQDRLY